RARPAPADAAEPARAEERLEAIDVHRAQLIDDDEDGEARRLARGGPRRREDQREEGEERRDPCRRGPAWSRVDHASPLFSSARRAASTPTTCSASMPTARAAATFGARSSRKTTRSGRSPRSASAREKNASSGFAARTSCERA